MKALLQRLHKLEGLLVPRPVAAGQSVAERLRERRRRRLTADRAEPDEDPPRITFDNSNHRPQSIGEVLRSHFQLKGKYSATEGATQEA